MNLLREMNRCKCGRFMKRLKDAVGLPLSTGFPPDRITTASTFPWSPFICENLVHKEGVPGFARVEYKPVPFLD